MDQIPTITDKRPQISGFIQQHRTSVVLSFIGFVVLVLFLSHPSAPPAPIKKTPPSFAGQPASPRTVTEMSQQIDGQIKAAATERDRAERMANDAKSATTQVPAPGTVQPQQGYAAAAPVVPAVRTGHDSNVALSFRAGLKIAGPVTEKDALQKLMDDDRAALAKNIAVTQAAQAAQAPPMPPMPQDEAERPELPTKHEASDPSLKVSIGKDYRLFEGYYIECVLANQLNGSFTGPVDVMVTNPVYSHDNQHILIPPGTRILGEALKVGTQGQQRLAVIFHRIKMPDGYSVDLDQFKGLDQMGETGLKDKVDNHWMSVITVSVALGLVEGFSQFGTGSALTSGGMDMYRQGVANSIGQSSQRILQSRLNLLPTITIRAGHRVRVVLAKDIMLPDYSNHRLPGDI